MVEYVALKDGIGYLSIQKYQEGMRMENLTYDAN